MNKNIEPQLKNRTSVCELCESTQNLTAYFVENMDATLANAYAYICTNCHAQLQESPFTEPAHWRCLNTSMWSEVPAVKVLSWRILTQLKEEDWSAQLLDMMYIEDELLEIAKSTLPQNTHFDANGNSLHKGDTVTIIKDLPVKGSSLVAKRGTAVRNISLVHDNPEHIEGKVEGQKIVILTQFVTLNK